MPGKSTRSKNFFERPLTRIIHESETRPWDALHEVLYEDKP
jgi:hypothetical protein